MTKDCYIKSVKRNNKRIYLIALSFTKNHHDAEDILQNVFLKLWKHNKEFQNDEHIDKWLTKVCVNESKNYIKLSFRKILFLKMKKRYILLTILEILMFLMLLCHYLKKSVA